MRASLRHQPIIAPRGTVGVKTPLAVARATESHTSGDMSVPSSSPPPLRAAQIRAELDKLVVGQVEAKERLSLLLSMHQAWDPTKAAMHPPPNGLIIGPTGSGKTFSIQVASKYLNIPFLVVDSTTLVPSGARNGNTIEWITDRLDVLLREHAYLHRGSKDDKSVEQVSVQKAIVFFDEFDKLALRPDDPNREWKGDLQRMLLKFVESYAFVTEGAATRGLFVLVGGAFHGIDGPDNIRKRRPEVASILRSAPKRTIVSDDVVNYGFMPELVARLPAIIQYEALPEDALLTILKHPETSPLLVWRSHFEQLGKQLQFSESFMKAVAKRAAALQMGARALQQIVFPALSRRAYAFEDSPEATIEITETILDFKE